MRLYFLSVAALALSTLAACGDSTGGSGSTGSGGSGGADATTSTDATTASTTTASTGTGEGGGGLLGFGAACEEDTECETGLCYPFGMGAQCSVLCPDDPADCPGETKECNNMDPPACKTP